MAVVTLTIYQQQLVITNAYFGYKPILIDARYITTVFFVSVFLAYILPKRISRPSDFFVVSFSFFSYFSFLIFASSPQKISYSANIFFLFVMAAPLAFSKFMDLFPIRFNRTISLNTKAVHWFIMALVMVTVAKVLVDSPSSASFAIDNVGIRRLASRDIFVGGALFSYLLGMTMNGLVPYLAFIFGMRKKLWGLAFCIIIDLGFYYAMGVKSIFFFSLMGYVVGVGARRGKLNLFYDLIFVVIIFLFLVYCVEYFFSGYSLVAEYFFRRAFVIPGYVVVAYIDTFFVNANTIWSVFGGADTPKGVSYFVGNAFFGNPLTNASTNAFIEALASGGVVWYLAIVFLVSGLFKLLDILYLSSGNMAYIFIGFLYSILIVEQAATTAFISSGPGLLLILVILTGRGIQIRRQ